MSASPPPPAHLHAAPPTALDDGAWQQLRHELAALQAENERLKQQLAAQPAAEPPAQRPAQPQDSPVQFEWAGTRSGGVRASHSALLAAMGSVFPMGIFCVDAAGVLTDVDSHLQHIFGLDRPGFAQLGWLAVIHPEDRQRAQAHWRHYVTRPQRQSIELRLQRADGQIRHVLVHNTPMLNAEGQFEGHFGFVQDITEQRELEAQARLKEELNRQIIASSPDCNKVLDLQGHLLQMTAHGCQLVGVDDFENVRHADWGTWWPGEGEALARAALQGAGAGQITRFVGLCPTFQGKPKWWDTVISPICDAAGQPVMLLAVSRDISELHRQQEEILSLNDGLEKRVNLRTQELAQANERISQTLREVQRLYDQAPCGYHLLDRNGLYLRINQTELDWLGYRHEEVVGQMHFWDRLAPDFKNTIQLRLEKMQCGAAPEPVEVDMLRRDGSRFRVLLTCAVALDEQGRFAQVNSNIMDISARHSAEQALSAQRTFLQTITDSVPVQLAFYDRDLICQFANASYARWLNWPPISLVGLHLSQVARPENFASSQAFLHAALAGEPQRFEGQRTFPDGTSFYASIEYTPFRLDGEVHGIVIQMVDITQRKAAEDRVRDVNQTLQHTLQQAQNLYNQAPCGYHSINASGIYVSMNDTELSWLGYERDEVLGKKSYVDFIAARHLDVAQSRMELVIAQQATESVEYEMFRRDGSSFCALVSTSAVRDADGHFLHSNSTVVDITGRKAAELALRDSQRFIKAITDHVPGLIAYLDTDLRFRFANANHLPVYGLEPQALLGKPISECLPDGVWSEASPRLQAALRGETQRFEAWRPTVQGRSIYISGTYLPDLHEGEVKGIFVQVIDITERKQIEERVSGLNAELEARIQARSIELLESEQRFRMMVDNMRDHAAFFMDAHGTISDWTTSAQRMDGFSANEMLGQHYQRLLERSQGEGSREQADNMLQLAKVGGQHEVHGWHQRKDGSRYWAHALLIALRDDGGELRGFAKITHDMTDAKRLDDLMRNINDELEERVIQRTAQLTAANKDLESFSYSVSHDLRSPLRHIASFVSLLQEHLGAQCDEVSTRYLSTISTSARHMSQLIDGLLAFSRLGRAAVNIAPVDFNLLLDTVLAQLTHDTEGRHIEWVVAPDFPVVHGDALLLREVWANLLSNAQKYTRPRERARIEVGWRIDPAKGQIFYVRDNGVGFDTKYSAKLFGVFQRLHRATEFEGTGIGLALTRRIVERHGGAVWAESQLGKGSVFSFFLPFENLSVADSPRA